MLNHDATGHVVYNTIGNPPPSPFSIIKKAIGTLPEQCAYDG